MNWGVVWYIDFADWSVISPCTKPIHTCVKFLVGIRSFTLYVLVQFFGKSEFCENGGFSLSGSHICGIHWSCHGSCDIYHVNQIYVHKTHRSSYNAPILPISIIYKISRLWEGNSMVLQYSIRHWTKPTIKCKSTIIICACVQFKFCTGTMASFVAVSDKENLAPDAKQSKLSLKLTSRWV